MEDKAFTLWVKWDERNTLAQLKCPGVYAIARSQNDISTEPFTWLEEIIYFGMTNAKGGLKSRLNQFDYTLKGGNLHGGAQRVRFKYNKYQELTALLYVSVIPYECDVTSNYPADLRIMGEVERFEYECFAVFAEEFNKLPEFNDKNRSRKK